MAVAKAAGALSPKKAKSASYDALFLEAKKLLAKEMSQAKAAKTVGMDPGVL